MVTTRKPKQNRSKNTYNSILLAGFISVKKHKLKHTTVLKVCEIAGVGSGSFYEYFENKEKLFIEMQNYFIDELSDLIFTITPEIVGLDVRDAMWKIFIKINELFSKNDNAYFHWLSNYNDFDTNISHVKAIRAINALAIEYAINHPEVLKIKNLKLMVYILINSSVSMIMNFFSTKNNGFEINELFECFIDLTMSYIENENNRLA